MDIQKLLDALLKEGLETGCYPGAAAAVGIKDKVLATSVCGVKAIGGDKVNIDTLYDMASLSKILAPTMLAFKAIEAGRLTLWDTLPMFLDDVPEERRGINIFQLMTHTAGFEPSFRLDKTISDPRDKIKAILESAPVCKPGEAPNYSCMGYIVLGAILEKVLGGRLNDLARDMVFKPLGMTSTGYLPKGDNIASTELDPETGKILCGVVHDENARFQGGVSANAGVFSSIPDMIKFCAMLSKGGDGFITKTLLKKAIVNYTPGFDVHRGLGFHLGGTEYNFMGDMFPADSFGHTGYTGTSIAIDPHTGFWVILLTNRVHPSRSSEGIFRFRRRFHNALYACNEHNLFDAHKAPSPQKAASEPDYGGMCDDCYQDDTWTRFRESCDECSAPDDAERDDIFED